MWLYWVGWLFTLDCLLSKPSVALNPVSLSGVYPVFQYIIFISCFHLQNITFKVQKFGKLPNVDLKYYKKIVAYHCMFLALYVTAEPAAFVFTPGF